MLEPAAGLCAEAISLVDWQLWFRLLCSLAPAVGVVGIVAAAMCCWMLVVGVDSMGLRTTRTSLVVRLMNG